MLLEELIGDLSEIPRQELQKRILRRFKGEKRTQAVLEYCAIFRKGKHRRWIQNLQVRSSSPDIVEFLKEWRPTKDGQGNEVVYFRLESTGCLLDSTPMKEVHLYQNDTSGHAKIRIGGDCAGKIKERNIFGDSQSGTSSGGMRSGGLRLQSMIDWLIEESDNLHVPPHIEGIVTNLISNGEISMTEKDQLVEFYDNNRLFERSELIGQRELNTLEKTLGPFRNLLPNSLDGILFSNQKVSIKDAEPLAHFIYGDESTENRGAILDRLNNNRQARRFIQQERVRLETMHGDVKGKCQAVLNYIQMYEGVNHHRRHGLSGLVLAMELYQSGFIMAEGDAEEVDRAYDKVRGVTKSQLKFQRDNRFRLRRVKKWKEKQSFAQKREMVNRFLDKLHQELEYHPMREDIWKVVNGTMTSRFNASRGKQVRSGYQTGTGTESDPRAESVARRNLKQFLAVGYSGAEFVHYVTDNKTGGVRHPRSFPETFMGASLAYEIPREIRQIAYDDAGQLRSEKTVRVVRSVRNLALSAFQDLVNEILKNYKNFDK